MDLRPYQSEAVEVANKTAGNVLIVAPTGCGKTHIIAGICSTNQDKNILIISHVKEILSQNKKKLSHYLPKEKIGIYSSGLGSRDIRQFTIAGIHSVYRKGSMFAHFDIIIVDEVHKIPAKGEGMYKSFFAEINPKKVIGLTATPFRLDHGLITVDHIFNKIDFNIDIVKLINQGYLCPVKTKYTEEQYDTSGIKKVAGDFSLKDMSEKLDKEQLTRAIINELLEYKTKRKHWLIFAIDIAHAEHITEILIESGITAAAVHSKLDIDRQEILNLFEDGVIQAIVCVEALTTGFDSPQIDLVAILRPTMSPGLFCQMVGRGFRISEDKEDFLVLDFAGNVELHGPINNLVNNIVQNKDKPLGKGKVPTKVCPVCAEILPIQTMVCTDCGHKYEIKPPKLTITPSKSDILEVKIKQKESKVSVFPVTNIRYSRFQKAGKPATLKVEYTCGISKFNEWIAIESEGFPRAKAIDWWRMRTDKPFPRNVDAALASVRELRQPKAVYVLKIAKYPEVIRYDW